MKAYVLSIRPKTLVAAVVPIVSAAILALATHHSLSYTLFFSALFCALFLQVATNLFNDVIDFKKGADDHKRIGPKRVTQSGLMTQKQVLIWAITVSLAAIACGVPLVLHGGWPFVVLGLCSLFLAYGYTGGPFPLAYLGIGDIFVVLFFGLVAVCGSYFLFAGEVSLPSVVLGVQVGFLATVLLAINNLRDSGTDKLVGKKTLAVRFGDRFVQWEIATLIFITFAATFFWAQHFQKKSFYIVFLALPLATIILKAIFDLKDKARLNRQLGLSGALMLLFSGLMWMALLL